MRSYDINYLDAAATNLGTMFEYMTSLEYDPIISWSLFTNSYVSKEIEKGNPQFLVGHSALDLVNLVFKSNAELEVKPFLNPSKYYWAGWIIAHYQNIRNISFYNLNNLLPINVILDKYDTLHEADISKFFSFADKYIINHKTETNLKKIRTASNLSQSMLAKKANVSIRNIQMYEQRQNNINKAQIDILLRLSKALSCNIEDLLEDINEIRND
ncbi:MAG: helix-turn-helix transcriptional regulator [Bacilli bacterium]|nr:helix-turn-helix transcriptional regulator [Bacilli bacterium]